MTLIQPSSTVGQIVANRPELARVFEELQIDYCCGGKRSLDEVCRERGLVVGELIDRLSAVSPASASEDWQTASLSALCDNI
jgi:regulator of cell morphogenesis and NO signaling